MIHGVDVSSVQQNVNAFWLAQQGYQFLIAKSYTGNDGADPFFEINVQNAKNAGLAVAAYCFLYPLPDAPNKANRNPKDQAALHYQHTGDIAMAADLEWPEVGKWSYWGCSASQIADWTLTYLQEYERISGRRPLLYTYPFFANAVSLSQDFASYDLWIASYTSEPLIPLPWTTYRVWQDTGGGVKLPTGIPCDTDQCNDLEWAA